MLRRVLEEFLQIGGVTSSALISHDGFLIESAGPLPCDRDELAVLASCAMDFFSRAGTGLGRGSARQFVLEHDEGSVIVIRVSGEELLVIIAGVHSRTGSLAYIIPKITTRVAAVI